MYSLGKFTIFQPAEFSEWLFAHPVTRVVRRIQIHHTYIPAYRDFRGNNHFQLLQSMEAAHLARGFAEIAQNLTTFPDGTIALCRSLDKIPAGIKGANTYGVCIENLGNFDSGCDVMTLAQKDAITRLTATLLQKFRLTADTNTIVYHHWYDLLTGERTNGSGTTKTCPGTDFFGGNAVADCQANFIPALGPVLAGLAAAAPAAPLSAAIQEGKVNASLLNVRSAGEPGAAIIKELRQETPVSVYEEKSGWYRIATDSQWVNKDYITLV